LITPKIYQSPFPVVVFVHGNGATQFDAYGYYRPALFGKNSAAAKLVIPGDNTFADSFLDFVVDWIQNTTNMEHS
jgi:hypothetical protein